MEVGANMALVIQTVRPLVNQAATALGGAVTWMNREVEDLTRQLPPNLALIARVGLLVAPVMVAAAILPRRVTFAVVGAAAIVAAVFYQVLTYEPFAKL